MPKEKECYREILDELDRQYPNRAVLKTKEVCEFTGLCYNTVKRYFPIQKHIGIDKRVLARKLAYDGK